MLKSELFLDLKSSEGVVLDSGQRTHVKRCVVIRRTPCPASAAPNPPYASTQPPMPGGSSVLRTQCGECWYHSWLQHSPLWVDILERERSLP